MPRRKNEIDLVQVALRLANVNPSLGCWVGAIGLLVALLLVAKGKSFFPLNVILALIFLFLSAVIGLRSLFLLIATSKARRPHGRAYSLEEIKSLTWRQFEQAVADLFRQLGYRVEEVGGSADGGVDLVLRDTSGAVHLVQCKQYRAWKVGVPHVREFYGAMAAHRTRCEGIFVTCGQFTIDAIQFAADKPIRLINGDQLVRMFNQANPLTPAVEHFTKDSHPSPNTEAPQDCQAARKRGPELGEQPVPACPRCGATMVKRTAARGKHAGRGFWGCSRFPTCRGVRSTTSTPQADSRIP